MKFTFAGAGDPAVGVFLALEALTLGVNGKASLWKMLKEIKDQYPQLGSTDFDELIQRADTQHDALERERVAAGMIALENSAEDTEPE